MRLVITQNKEKYLTNNSGIERPKLLMYKELLSLIYNDPINIEPLENYGFEYKKVLLKNIMFVNEKVDPEMNQLKQDLKIKENSLEFLNHYQIEADFLLDPIIEKKLPNFKSTYKHVELKPREITQSIDIFHECQYVVNEISKLLYTGTDINKIKIIVANEEYMNTIMLYLNMNNINYKIDTKINICLNRQVKALLQCSKYEEIVELASQIENIETQSKVVGILNRSKNIDEIKNQIKKAQVKTINLDDAIEITILKEHGEKVVFVTGVFANNYQLDVKDNDFYSDLKKQQLGLKTSIEKTQENYNLFNKVINDAYLITKPHSDISGEVKAYGNFSVIKDDQIYQYTKNSELVNKVNYSNLKKLYGEETPRYHLINGKVELTPAKDFAYQKYHVDLKLKTSASSIEMFNKCSYSYYLRYVLKLSAKKVDMWNLNLGTFAHHILEYGYAKDDINDEVHRYINQKLVDKQGSEIILFDTVEKQIIINMIPFLEKLVLHTKNQFYPIANIELEKEIRSNDINLIGYIDKFITLDNEFMILDYKTGNAKMNFDFIHHGIEIQNMLYAYIIEKENPSLKLKGTFRQKAKPRVLNDGDLFEKEYNINGKLDVNKVIDYDYVKIQRKKDGSIYSRSALGRKYIDLYFGLIEENIQTVIKQIQASEFNINPKKHKEVIDACKYCDYSEVCYKTVESYEKIAKMEVSSEF